MGELRVTETFEKGGDTYEKGKVYVVAEKTAKWAEKRGYGSRAGEKSEEGTGEGEIPKLEGPEAESVWDKLKRKAKSESGKPPDWNPERGDWLLGTVEKTGEGENNRFAAVKVVEGPVEARQKLGEGEYEEETVRPGGKVLLWEVKDLIDFFDRIRAGSKVAVRYTGEVRTSSDHEAKIFDCAVDE